MNRYPCCDERRRSAVLEGDDPLLNGLDFIEVRDAAELPLAERQKILFAHFLRPLAGAAVAPENVRIAGGVRIPEVAVIGTQIDPDDARVLVIEVDAPGDFSLYTLQLEGSPSRPLPWLDPALSTLSLSFKVVCETDFDCAPVHVCPPAPRSEPEIDYLAKDFTSFRQAMLDRMALVAPSYRERNPADLGIALVELFAYVGDSLSYEQDAWAMEAYLATARRRHSIRRHARLVDYRMHDGANARTFVTFETRANAVVVGAHTQLLTRVAGEDPRLEPDSRAVSRAFAAGTTVFETMQSVELYVAHNHMRFHTFSDRECCLPQGATSATLRGGLHALEAGDLVGFEEVLGPRTGEAKDADPSHRHVVRLTQVGLGIDPLDGSAITEIAWADDDALPFPLCISSLAERAQGRALIEDVSVARGNVTVADHGCAIEMLSPAPELLGPVPAPDARFAPAGGTRAVYCGDDSVRPPAPRFRQRLSAGPVTQAATTIVTIDNRRQSIGFDPSRPAASVFDPDLRRVLPVIELTDDRGVIWRPARDLLSSDGSSPEFVAESDDAGRVSVRFGDDVYGLRPAAGTSFRAHYRVGNGSAGNIGADALFHVVSEDADVLAVRNVVPARGGLDPEPVEHARQMAPVAFRTLERAVTPDDYVQLTQRHPQVQRAAATLRWTGSWHTVFITVDRTGGRPIDEPFERELRAFLERYRLAGRDVQIDAPIDVPLEVCFTVCVAPDYHRSDVQRALLELFGNRNLPDGRRGLFHPDNFSFGEPVYLSRLYSAAHAVTGVQSVTVDTFQRLGDTASSGLDAGLLAMDRLEVARLDNDPNFPDRGRLRLDMRGGR